MRPTGFLSYLINSILINCITVVDLTDKTDRKYSQTHNLAIAHLEAMLKMQHINETFVTQ